MADAARSCRRSGRGGDNARASFPAVLAVGRSGEAGAADGAAPVRASAMLGRRQARRRPGAAAAPQCSQWRRRERSWRSSMRLACEPARSALTAAAAVSRRAGSSRAPVPRATRRPLRVAGRPAALDVLRGTLGVLRAATGGRRVGCVVARGAAGRSDHDPVSTAAGVLLLDCGGAGLMPLLLWDQRAGCGRMARSITAGDDGARPELQRLDRPVVAAGAPALWRWSMTAGRAGWVTATKVGTGTVTSVGPAVGVWTGASGVADLRTGGRSARRPVPRRQRDQAVRGHRSAAARRGGQAVAVGHRRHWLPGICPTAIRLRCASCSTTPAECPTTASAAGRRSTAANGSGPGGRGSWSR